MPTSKPPFPNRATYLLERITGTDPFNHPLNCSLTPILQATGAYAKAEPLYKRALAICKKQLSATHPETATALNNLAALYRTTGAHAKAEPLYKEALTIYKKQLGPAHPDTATALSNLAELYHDINAYRKAKPLYQQTLAIRRKQLGPTHPDTGISLNNLAGLYLATAVYTKATQLYRQALSISEKQLGPAHPDTAIPLNNLAALYLATRNFAEACPLYERAQSIQEKNTVQFFFSGSEGRKQAYLQQRVRNVYESIAFSLTYPTSRSTALGLTSVLQYKGRVLDAMSDNGARLRRSVAPEDQELFDQLAAIAQEFSTVAFRGPENLCAKVFRKRLNMLAHKQEHLQAELSSRSAELRQTLTPITLRRVQQALPADAILVEWFRYETFSPKTRWTNRLGAARYIAYVLKRTGDPVVIDLGDAQSIDDLIPEFRTALSDRASTSFQEIAYTLFKKLIQPLRGHLGQSNHLLLSPDGTLNLVPFAALVDEHGDYLLQRFELTYLTSGRDLLRMETEPPPATSAVVLLS